MLARSIAKNTDEKISLILIFILVWSLTSCGFSLRKLPQIELGFQPVLVISKQKYDQVYLAMIAALDYRQVATSDTMEAAATRLEIFNESELERETLTTTDSGNEQLFTIQWQFRFLKRLDKSNWKTLISDQLISTDKVVNQQRLENNTGPTIEQVREELRKALANKVIQQIDSYILSTNTK